MFGKSIFRRGVIAGEARGKVLALSESASWYQRKTDAEARGERFDEPPPWQRNGNRPTHYDEDTSP